MDKWQFEIGEWALDIHNKRVRIISMALRPEDYKNRRQYLVENEGGFFTSRKQRWELEACLTKIIT